MELSERFENAAAQLRSIAAVQALVLCTDQQEKESLEQKQAQELAALLESGARSIVELDSFLAVEKWANDYPKMAVGDYLTRLLFDPSKRKFIVLRKPANSEVKSFSYIGPIYKNCGPSGAQSQALAADSAFTKTLTAAYSTDFGEAQDLFKELHSNFESIIAKGPSQQGASPEELAAENSQAINQAAAANKQVQQQIGEKAAMTGAVPGVESGVTAAVRADAATKVEENLGNQEGKILTSSYDIGRENYNNAVRGEEELSSATMNPVTSAASPVLGAEKTTGEQADQNAAASSSWMGLVGGLADAAVKGVTGGIGFGGSKAPGVPTTPAGGPDPNWNGNES